MCPTREIWKAKEAALVAILVVADKGRGDERAHQPPSHPLVVPRQRGLVLLPIFAPESAVNDVKHVSERVGVGCSGLRVRHHELHYRRRVNDPPVPLAEAARSCRMRLLPHNQLIVRPSKQTQRQQNISINSTRARTTYGVFGVLGTKLYASSDAVPPNAVPYDGSSSGPSEPRWTVDAGDGIMVEYTDLLLHT